MTKDRLGVDEGEEAVSPVIGTILMVAITVILAGVVTASFLGFKPIPQEQIQAGVQVQYDPNGDQMWVTYVDKQTSDYLNVTFDTASSGDAKATLVDTGGQLYVQEGLDYPEHRNDDGAHIHNFSKPIARDERIEVVVTAVKGPTEDGWQRTVIYTEGGRI